MLMSVDFSRRSFRMLNSPFFSMLLTSCFYSGQEGEQPLPAGTRLSYEHFNTYYYYYCSLPFHKKEKKKSGFPVNRLFSLNNTSRLNYDSVPG
jgi:hypothetical protein